MIVERVAAWRVVCDVGWLGWYGSGCRDGHVAQRDRYRRLEVFIHVDGFVLSVRDGEMVLSGKGYQMMGAISSLPE